MMHNNGRVLAHIKDHPEGHDDDHIGAALGIDRIQINAICHRLAASGAILRGKGPSDRKIINRPASNQGTDSFPMPATLTMQPATSGSMEITLTGPIVWLADSDALQLFAYKGEAKITEDTVKSAIKQTLEADGWHTVVRFGHDHGIDIEAVRGNERFVLEAKGEGFSSPARSVNFDGALGELLRRMNAADARYGLAMPAHRQFIGLVARLPLWIRQRLSLWFFFVRPKADGLEVGVFPPDSQRNLL